MRERERERESERMRERERERERERRFRIRLEGIVTSWVPSVSGSTPSFCCVFGPKNSRFYTSFSVFLDRLSVA